MNTFRTASAALAVASACVLVNLAQAQQPLWITGSPTSDTSVVLIYNPDDGTLEFTTPALNPKVTSIELQVDNEMFIPGEKQPWPPFVTDNVVPGNCAAWYVPPESGFPTFDVCTESKMFFLKTAGVEPTAGIFGPVLPPGLSVQDLLLHISAQGSYLPDGDLGKYNGGKGVALLYVPEPSTAVAGLSGVFGLLLLRRRVRQQ